jgi:predicted dehydrogenase
MEDLRYVNKKIAIIGAGYMAREHLKVYNDIPNTEIIGIYSRTKKKAIDLSLLYSIKFVADSISELYSLSKADLVIIAVTELEVRKVCEEAFKFSWMLLIEKPIGLNLAEASYLCDLAKRNSLSVFVALNRRHYSSTRIALKELRENPEKRVVQIFDQEYPSIALQNGSSTLVTENWMYANSIHLIDYFNLFCRGELLSVENICTWEQNKFSFVLSKLKYSSGDIGVYNAIWEGPSPWIVSINTKSVRVELKPLEQVSIQNFGERKSTVIPVDDCDLKFKPGLRRQAEETIAALNGEVYFLPSIADGLSTMKIINKIYGN